MSSFGRALRVLAAAALLTTVGIGFASSAGAVTTGTVTAITNGVTVTYSSPGTALDNALVVIYSSPHTCASNDNPMTATYNLSSSSASASYAQLGASPRTLQFGSTVAQGFSQGTIGVGDWVVCLIAVGNTSNTVLSSAAMTAVDPSATTTTTSTPGGSTSTTAAGGGTDPAGGDPLVPTFTG